MTCTPGARAVVRTTDLTMQDQPVGSLDTEDKDCTSEDITLGEAYLRTTDADLLFRQIRTALSGVVHCRGIDTPRQCRLSIMQAARMAIWVSC
jgi:hypothetical protein